MRIEFSHKLIRDGKEIEIDVYADQFVSDHSVGIGLYPEEMVASDANGNEIELTDDEELDLINIAIECLEGREYDADLADMRNDQ